MSSIAIVYHSEKGRTKEIASLIATGVEMEGLNAYLMDCTQVDFARLNECDGIIFGCPTYMGSISAKFKTFIDSTGMIWQKQLWKDKVAAGFSNSSALNGDKLSTLYQLCIFAMQHGMIWVGLDLFAGISSSKSDPNSLNRLGIWLGLGTQSNTDEDIKSSPPKGDRETAIYFGQRLANIVKKMKR
jgi:NAD(P)H dehydrogenase (quinone)